MTNEIFNPYGKLYNTFAFEGARAKYEENKKRLLAMHPDQMFAAELLFLQLYSSDLLRNNGYAKTARARFVENLGAITVKWINKKGQTHTLMQDLWDEFCSDPSLDGYGNMNNVQSLWNGTLFEFGSCFTRKHIRREGNRNRVPLKLEIIHPQTHDVAYFGTGQRNIRNGITFVDTKPTEYHFRPNIFHEFPQEFVSPTDRITIGAGELLHFFRREIPGQWIGVPFLAPIIVSLYELDELLDATVAKQKASQAISILVQQNNPTNILPVGVGIQTTNDDNVQQTELRSKGTNVVYFNRGESVLPFQSADIGNNYFPLVSNELRRIASVCNVPYLQLTSDISGVNFSTIKYILTELRARIEFIHQFETIPLAVAPLANYFQALAKATVGKNVANAIPRYQLPRFYGADALKDTQADVLEIQAGLATMQSKLDERHMSFEEISHDRELMKSLGMDMLLQTAPSGQKQGKNVQPNSNSAE